MSKKRKISHQEEREYSLGTISSLYKYSTEGDKEKIEELLDKEPITTLLTMEHYVIMLKNALEHNHQAVVDLVLERCGKDEINNSWISYLHFAAAKGYTSVVEMLANGISKQNIDSFDKLNSCTPLHYAAANGHVEVVKALLQAGADAGIKNKDGYGALDKAITNGHIEVALALCQSGSQEIRKESHKKLAQDKAMLDALGEHFSELLHEQNAQPEEDAIVALIGEDLLSQVF